MLIHLIEFGGIVFWIFIGIAFITMFLSSESYDADLLCPALIIISLFVVYGLSNAPILDWKFFVGHFGIGVVWSLVLFHFKLLKVRKYIKLHPDKVVDGKFDSRGAPDNIRYIYRTEPSFAKFSSRITCWPFSIIKFMFGDILLWCYEQTGYILLKYKNIVLGLK